MWQYKADNQATPKNDGLLITEQDAEVSLKQLVEECIVNGYATADRIDGEFDEDGDNVDLDAQDTYSGDVLDAFVEAQSLNEQSDLLSRERETHEATKDVQNEKIANAEDGSEANG